MRKSRIEDTVYKRKWAQSNREKIREANRRDYILHSSRWKKYADNQRDKVPGYKHLHKWVRRKKGKPVICSDCKTNERRIQWANIDAMCRKNLDDFVALCPSCHYAYDQRLRNEIQDFTNSGRTGGHGGKSSGNGSTSP